MHYMPYRCDNSGWIKLCLSVAQLALSVVMIVLVRYQLQDMATSLVHGTLVYGSTCYLAAPDDWLAACTFADVVAYISVLLTFVVSVLQLYLTSLNSRLRSTRLHNTPCNKCTKRVWWAQQLLLGFGLLWWAAAATLLQIYISRADSAGLPRDAQRAAVSACCWLSVVLLSGILATDWVPRCRQASPPGPAGIPLGYPTFFSAGPQQPAATGLPPIQQQQQPAPPQQPPSVQRLQSAPQLLVPVPPAAVVIGIPVLPGQAAQQQLPVPRTVSAPASTTPPLAAGIGPAQLQMALLELGRLPGRGLVGPGPPQQQVQRPQPATHMVIGQRAVPGQALAPRAAGNPGSARGAIMRVAVVDAHQPSLQQHAQPQPSLQQQAQPQPSLPQTVQVQPSVSAGLP